MEEDFEDLKEMNVKFLDDFYVCKECSYKNKTLCIAELHYLSVHTDIQHDKYTEPQKQYNFDVIGTLYELTKQLEIQQEMLQNFEVTVDSLYDENKKLAKKVKHLEKQQNSSWWPFSTTNTRSSSRKRSSHHSEA